MPETRVRKIYLKMYDNPEICADRIVKYLRTLPLAHRRCIQSLMDKFPLTVPLSRGSKPDYHLEDLSDSGD